MGELERLRARVEEDEKLLRRAEQALTQIKVSQGLSEEHAAVLAALRIRLTGQAGKSLEQMMAAAGDLGGPRLEELLEREERPKASLDDLLARKPRKREWPGGGRSRP
ncbi:MAG TPA: hypothetical protein VNO34_08565 [Actinomycetota bacterium]|nr:hypothetical protein [Actinomycetota bacterium]